jgi:IS605 OrfB family transposase
MNRRVTHQYLPADSRGRWYFNVVVDVDETLSLGQGAVGIDLGLKDIATTSDGDKLEAGRWYREAQAQLGIAQRASKKQRVKAIHAKIANRRKDALHKFSRQQVDRCGEIYIGNVSSSKLVKTKMAKSVLDAGWSSLKTMLEYKGAHAGIVVREVNESFSTQVCSCYGVIPASSPKGRADLRIRKWACSSCGAQHDREHQCSKEHPRARTCASSCRNPRSSRDSGSRRLRSGRTSITLSAASFSTTLVVRHFYFHSDYR